MGNGMHAYQWLRCHCICATCGETWDAHPASQYTPYCDACAQVLVWEREARKRPGIRLANALLEIVRPVRGLRDRLLWMRWFSWN